MPCDSDFIYYSKIIQEIAGRHIFIIDGNEGTVRNMIRTMNGKMSVPENNCRKGRITFYSSSMEDSHDRVNKLLAIAKSEKRLNRLEMLKV